MADQASEGPIKGTIAQILEFKWKTRDWRWSGMCNENRSFM
ncbi:MAG: hypothetical protein WCA12_04725 [Burkholderiales bacterium]